MAGSVSGSLSGAISGDISGGLSGSSSIRGNLVLPSEITDREIDEIENELRDVRVGIDGTVYSSAGVAVRTQIQNVRDEMQSIYIDDGILFVENASPTPPTPPTPTITNLTGTTWIFNDYLNIPTPQYQYQYYYNIEFTMPYQQSYSGLKICLDYPVMIYDVQPIQWGQEQYIPVYQASGWGNYSSWKTIRFTGGQQVQDVTLIAWLQENATLVITGG